MVWASFPMALALLALKSYLLKDWRLLCILCTAPYLFVVLFYKFMPESIKWLHEQGKNDELVSTLRRIAYWNKKALPATITINPPKEVHTGRSKPIDIFRTRDMAVKSFANGFIWCLTAMGYFGIMLAVNDLNNSIYSNFAILNVADLCAVVSSTFICSRFGRKKTTLVSMFIAALSCFSLALIPSDFVVIKIICGILGKFFVTIAFNVCFVWTGEIYPTRLRAEGIGFCEVCAKSGSAAAPWVANFAARFGAWVPFTVMGVLLVFGSLCGIGLPETKNEKMPEKKTMQVKGVNNEVDNLTLDWI